MVARVKTVAFQGIDCLEVDVEVQLAPGLPAFTVVGLPDKAVGESRERVRAALVAIGLALPHQRITVNLAPADLAGYTVLGELGLDGRINSVAGVLPAAISASAAGRGLICPAVQGSEA